MKVEAGIKLFERILTKALPPEFAVVVDDVTVSDGNRVIIGCNVFASRTFPDVVLEALEKDRAATELSAQADQCVEDLQFELRRLADLLTPVLGQSDD
jgi:hypothetical protein